MSTAKNPVRRNIDLSVKVSGCWPYDKSYYCHCPDCNCFYVGPKRSPKCWDCTGANIKQEWVEYSENKLSTSPKEKNK